MHISEYKYLRALELFHGQLSDVGGWQTWIMRLEVGEGIPPPEIVARFPLLGPNGHLAPPPRFKPGEVEMRRAGHYHRVIGSKHIVRSLNKNCDVATNIYLFPAWAKPDRGYIPLPRIDEQPLVVAHNVRIMDHHPGLRQFKFENWWGSEWGLDGYGIFDYAYVDYYCFDCWAPIYFGDPVKPVARHHRNAVVYRWDFVDAMGNRNHGIGYERRDKSRLAWAFMVERNGALEIQELYVWETFRDSGLGTHLAETIKKIARERGLPLRLFVPFSDAQRESPRSYLGMVKIVKRLGLRFHRCPVPWAAYYATNELTGGAEEPIEPVVFPSRPKSTLAAVLMAASMAVSPDVRPQMQAVRSQVIDRRPVNEVVQQLEHQDIKLINRRRSQLIWKRHREGSLPETETAELENLQKESLQRGLEHQPPSKITPEQLAYIEAKLSKP